MFFVFASIQKSWPTFLSNQLIDGGAFINLLIFHTRNDISNFPMLVFCTTNICVLPFCFLFSFDYISKTNTLQCFPSSWACVSTPRKRFYYVQIRIQTRNLLLSNRNIQCGGVHSCSLKGFYVGNVDRLIAKHNS